MNHGISGTGNVASNRRARVACQGCNHRKVRCDVTRTGIPCSNCMHEAANCEVLPRKKHRPRRTRATILSSESEFQQARGQRYAPATLSSKSATGTLGSTYRDRSIVRENSNEVDESSSHAHSPIRIPSSHLSGAVNGQSLSSLKDNATNSKSSRSDSLVSPLDAEGLLPDDSSLSYIGDRRGARSFVYDLCHPGAPQEDRVISLPKASNASWRTHEIEYLRQEGVFATLPDEVCDELIRCYFHHVHFFLPIIDAPNFLTEYVNNGRHNISMLLFWSMLLAAANFVGADTLQKAGFTSRKAMKTAFYACAKALYDFDHGTDKLILIQSVILMGFWYTDPQDHTGAWYWIGIAITLSQTLGLHRCPQLSNRSQRFSEARQPLVRRIWWACVVRDRWLSVAKGRPMRIHHEDCDIPKPVAEDILYELESIPVQTRDRFIPEESETLANMWIRLVKISATLGSILRIHYRANGPKPVVADIDNNAEELRTCKEQDILPDTASDILRLHAYQLELFYEATVVVLYRPYVLNGPSVLPGEVQARWQKLALDRARAAASNTNNVLEKIIELNVVDLLKPMIITTLIPAMQIHLFDCKSTVSLLRGLGSNKLNLCMLVLSKLRDTYWSASVIYRLFERAQVILNGSNSDSSNTTKTLSSSPHRQRFRASGHGFGERNHEPQQEGGPHENQQLQQQQQQQHEEVTMLPISQPNLLVDEQGVLLGMNELPSFSAVDQLLSPGFSLSDDAFQFFLAEYDNTLGGVYDQILPMSSESQIDLLYNV